MHTAIIQVINVEKYTANLGIFGKEERVKKNIEQTYQFDAKTKAAAMSVAMRFAKSGWDLETDFKKIEKIHQNDLGLSYIKLYT